MNGKKAYEYTYDSLGRLIYSTKLQGGNTVLFTSHEYDTSDRITGQTWQIGEDAFRESYTYNGASIKIEQIRSVKSDGIIKIIFCHKFWRRKCDYSNVRN